MIKNEFRQETVQKPKRKKKEKIHRESRLGKAFRSILDGTILTRDNVLRLLPFGLYVTFLVILYIANSYYSEKTVRRIDMVRNEIIEMESEFVATKSDLMMVGRQSEIAKKVDTLGLYESLEPPVKLFAKRTEIETPTDKK